jgi:hypothetical protein
MRRPLRKKSNRWDNPPGRSGIIGRHCPISLCQNERTASRPGSQRPQIYPTGQEQASGYSGLLAAASLDGSRSGEAASQRPYLFSPLALSDSCLLLLVVIFLCSMSNVEAIGYERDRCGICGRDLGDKVYTVTDKITGKKLQICPECSVLPNDCYLCGLPVYKDFKELPDGRYLCARDAASAILDETLARRICTDTRNSLDRIFSRHMAYPERLDILVVDRVNLTAVFKLPGNDLQCPNVLGYYRCVTNETSVRHEVNLLSGLRACDFKAVCAHELTHAWVHDNVPPERKKTLGTDAHEGFCELMAYLLASAKEDEDAKKQILNNAYTRGQIHLFIEAEQRFGLNEVLDWMKYGVDRILDKNDLSRVRKVEMPGNPSPARELYTLNGRTTLSPALANGLQLKAVTWNNQHPTALINNRLFAPKESHTVKLETTNLLVHCLEVRSNSVLIEVEGRAGNQLLKLASP